MIIDYEYYSSHGGNKIPQNEFNKYSTIASGIITSYIMNRDYSAYQGIVKNTACIVVDLVYDREQVKTYERNIALGSSSSVTSEKVGEYSINYQTYNTGEMTNVILSYNEEIESVIFDNLAWTGLLSRAIGVIR